MTRFVRFSTLVIAGAVLAFAALVWVLLPRTPSLLPKPLPVAADEAEIVWLQNASNTAGWERLVTALQQAAEHWPDLIVDPDDDAFPSEATACPQVAVRRQGKPGRLVFRWYKITSDWKTTNWVEALTARQPPPLAIVGGDSSEPAIDLARALQKAGQLLPEQRRPLFCITTATADNASNPNGDGETPLTQIYPGRTYRFCFTNRQMAQAVIGFIWSQPELRPDTEPVYMVYWADDPYSNDLTGSEGGFRKALTEPAAQSGAAAVARDVAWLAASRATGGFPLPLEGLTASQFRLGLLTPPQMIDSGVGSFDRPNTFEAASAGYLLNELSKNSGQRRPLLLLSAQQAPMRRFLRALVRTAPDDSQRFVVGTGDSIPFNTIYRDRNVAWPIQDLPLSLVFFAHRNPVDERAGFQATSGRDGDPNRDGEGPAATSTDGLLLNRDIVETLVQAAWTGDALAVHAEALRQALGQMRWQPEGRVKRTETASLLFDKDGNRKNGTGEHVVWLRPTGLGRRVEPEAEISVWPLPNGWRPGQHWDGEAVWKLGVRYDGDISEGGGRASN